MDKEHRMMKAEILQGEGLKQREIAEMLGVTDRTVRNYLKGRPHSELRPRRPSKLDPFKPAIDAILEENPTYNRGILIERLARMGYSGKISILRDYARGVARRLQQQAVIRFETEMGRQAQVDWKEFGKQTVDGHETKLSAFVMVLGYSRKPFVCFTTSMDQATMLACHVLAFSYFGGIPHEILYDNMRTAFAPDAEGVWQPTKRLLALAAHYGFTPRHCRIRRPETKGKVERTVGYLGNNFWPRLEGQELSLKGLNGDVVGWLAAIGDKPLSDFGESRATRFTREQPTLQGLPSVAFDVRTPVPLTVNRESFIQYETNRYSVPPEYIGSVLTLLVHPLHREVELELAGRGSRRFELLAPGAQERSIIESDRKELQKRWNHDRSYSARLRRPRRHVQTAEIEVLTRSPSIYEAFCGGATASDGALS